LGVSTKGVVGGRDGEMGSPSGEPAPEAFRKGDSAGYRIVAET